VSVRADDGGRLDGEPFAFFVEEHGSNLHSRSVGGGGPKMGGEGQTIMATRGSIAPLFGRLALPSSVDGARNAPRQRRRRNCRSLLVAAGPLPPPCSCFGAIRRPKGAPEPIVSATWPWLRARRSAGTVRGLPGVPPQPLVSER
jgi:hypothetical protein